MVPILHYEIYSLSSFPTYSCNYTSIRPHHRITNTYRCSYLYLLPYVRITIRSMFPIFLLLSSYHRFDASYHPSIFVLTLIILRYVDMSCVTISRVFLSLSSSILHPIITLIFQFSISSSQDLIDNSRISCFQEY